MSALFFCSLSAWWSILTVSNLDFVPHLYLGQCGAAHVSEVVEEFDMGLRRYTMVRQNGENIGEV